MPTSQKAAVINKGVSIPTQWVKQTSKGQSSIRKGLIKTEAAVELELDQASERLLKPFARQAKANESELYY